MKGFIKNFSKLSIFLLLSSLMLSGCKYYKQKQVTKVSPSLHYIVHSGDEMMELSEPKFHYSDSTFSGILKPFEGLARQYYDMAVHDASAHNGKNKAIRRGGSSLDKAAISQMHFFLIAYELAENEEITFRYEDIVRFERMKNDPGKKIGLIVIPVIIGAAIIIACNCPHVYISDIENNEYSMTLFTGAKAPVLERNDYKIIPEYINTTSSVNITVANEDNEDQYTNLLELWAVYHDSNTTVVPDRFGEVYTIQDPVEPILALDNNENSIQHEINAIDNESYIFNTDSLADLSELYLNFKNIESNNEAKLILNLKNTKWSGYVYDEFNSLFGEKHGKWVEKNKDKPLDERLKWMKEQGIVLLVDLKTENGWENIDYVELIGDISFNSIAIPLELSGAENVELRLRSGYMFWELDYAGLDFSDNKNTDVEKLKPIVARGSNGEDFVNALYGDDDLYMSHLGSGNSTEIEFEPFSKNEDKKVSLILRSKGYYLYNKEYEGKVQRKELVKFKNPGELSRYSKRLYESLNIGLVFNEES